MIEHIVFYLFALVLLGGTVFGIVRAVRGSDGHRGWVLAVLVVWAAALFFMTVRPGSGGVRLNLVPIIVDGPGSAIDALRNAVVFVPLGLLLATVRWKLIPVLGIALAVSLSIEVTQYLTNLGRTADVNDLITNVAGAGIGWGVAWAIRRARRARASAVTHR